jgi:hypothetical protein
MIFTMQYNFKYRANSAQNWNQHTTKFDEYLLQTSRNSYEPYWSLYTQQKDSLFHKNEKYLQIHKK